MSALMSGLPASNKEGQESESMTVTMTASAFAAPHKTNLPVPARHCVMGRNSTADALPAIGDPIEKREDMPTISDCLGT